MFALDEMKIPRSRYNLVLNELERMLEGTGDRDVWIQGRQPLETDTGVEVLPTVLEEMSLGNDNYYYSSDDGLTG